MIVLPVEARSMLEDVVKPLYLLSISGLFGLVISVMYFQ
jgi:hypothetical protein